MPLPWVLLGGAVLLGAALASGRGNNDDDHEEQRCKEEQAARKRAAQEREKAQKQAAKQSLREQFDERLSEAHSVIEENAAPYFSMEFNGHFSIEEDINKNNQRDFFGVPLQNTEMQPLRKTAANLNYVKEAYNVEITPDIDLHYALQALEDCKLALQEARQLKQTILQTQINSH